MSRIVFESSTRSFLQKASRVLNGDSHAIGTFIHDFSNGAAASIVQELVSDDTDLVAIGPEIALDHGMALAAEISRLHPEVSVVLVTEPDGSVWEPALRAGVVDVVAPQASPQEVSRAFNAVLERTAQRRRNLSPEAPANGAEATADPAERRVITVISPKGGSGKTMTSTNLAVGLAQRNPGETVLVDFDFEFGDVTNALQLDPDHSIYDAARSGEKLDLTTLKVFLAPHASGLYALAAPPKPELAEDVTPEAAGDVLKLLASQFRYVVVDTASGFGEYTLAAIDNSTDILLMTAMDVGSVRALSKAIDVLDRLQTGSCRSA